MGLTKLLALIFCGM